jgi:hypothetical protein
MIKSNIDKINAKVPKPQLALLDEQTAWTFLANIVHIYRRYFGVVVAAAGVLFVLPAIIAAWAMSNPNSEESQPALIIAAILAYINMFLTPAVLTVVLSDICLGNAPTLKRAFARVLGRGRWWNLLTTAMLVGLAFWLGPILLFTTAMVVGLEVWLGLILAIVPGLWMMVRTIFAMPIVVLEDRRNRDAIRRSFSLTKGEAWRLTGLFFLIFILLQIFGIAFGFVVGSIFELMGLTSALGIVDDFLVSFTIFILSLPAYSIFVVLLYYEQRVRRELYDAQSLAEDLMR